MKKQWLGLTILLGLAGIASHTHAVYVNEEGLGEVLLYPFYTVENGQDTYIAVVNTADMTKAVRVRLREAMNSARVLDFNLYLAPQDHWAGVITRDPEGVGALLKTADTSCTVPAIPAAGTPLHNRYYADANSSHMNADGGPQGLERTREGFVEIIEMGVIDDSVVDQFGAEAAATSYSDGTPPNCALLRAAWQEQPLGSGNVVGEWEVLTANFLPFYPELAGGLYGYGVLINPQEGTNATYDAIALSAFAGEVLHAHPASATPNLSQAAPRARILDRDKFIAMTFDSTPLGGLDAVSAVLMHDIIASDYVLEPSIAAGTDWVVTLPTKRAYVNREGNAVAPFLKSTSAVGGACEQMTLEFWDRQSNQPVEPLEDDWIGGADPFPSGVPLLSVVLCGGVNVLSFLGPQVNPDDENLEGYSSALYPSENIQTRFSVPYNNGWARLGLRWAGAWGEVDKERTLLSDDNTQLHGLPVIGFAVQKYANSTIEGVGNSGAFYSGVSRFKTTRLLQHLID